MKIDSADLMMFACIAEEGSFSRAADKLALPNSTLSRRIARLEGLLGERLFTRTTRKVVVTDFGQAVLNHAQQIVSEVEATVAIAENRRAVPTGHLRISMPGDFTPDMIGKFLADFIEKFPGITLDIDVSQRRVDIIGENFDLALRMGSLQNDATLVARAVGTFRTGLYASPSYLKNVESIVQPDDLLNHSVLKLQAVNGELNPWILMRGDEKWSGNPPTRATANSPGVLIHLARSGAGITSLATHFAYPWLASGELVRVLEQWESPGIPVWAVFPGRRLMPSRTRIFIDSLVENFSGFSAEEYSVCG